ncbi:hypothetical protein GGR56DRAFT_4261 [Xylariaceae sp. FL0804]|nr:hypothetical protein GGR56DRAFT_4261 [Xylariaceae sp. FL0804]
MLVKSTNLVSCNVKPYPMLATRFGPAQASFACQEGFDCGSAASSPCFHEPVMLAQESGVGRRQRTSELLATTLFSNDRPAGLSRSQQPPCRLGPDSFYACPDSVPKASRNVSVPKTLADFIGFCSPVCSSPSSPSFLVRSVSFIVEWDNISAPRACFETQLFAVGRKPGPQTAHAPAFRERVGKRTSRSRGRSVPICMLVGHVTGTLGARRNSPTRNWGAGASASRGDDP